ncbi:MAG: PIN domain-containing protein [Saprospiraceae bacterium]
MNKVFVDTDVILDFLLDRLPFADYASVLFSLSEEGKIRLFTSGLVFSNCYYVLRRIASHRKVMEKLNMLSAYVEVISMGSSTVKIALELGFKDFEDALQNFAAKEAKLQILLTRNTKDYSSSDLSVMTPEVYLASFHA